MVISRRAALRWAATALTAPAVFTSFAEHPYPSRPVQLLVAYPAGGGTDTLARQVAEALVRELGQSVVVINKPGGAGLIGTSAAMRAAPDGYTLLLDAGNSTLRPAIEPATPFKASDFVPVALLTETPVALVVSGSLPVDTVAELIAYSKAHPGKINYASTGPGSPQHLMGELMKQKAGLDWEQIPYQGGAPALADLASGRVHVMFSNPVPLMPYLNTGRIKVLAVTSTERLPALKGVPTMREAGQSDFGVAFWNGVLAPAGTPAPIVEKVGAALLKVMAKPRVREALVRQGSVPSPLGPKDFAAYMGRDTSYWKDVASTIAYQPIQ